MGGGGPAVLLGGITPGMVTGGGCGISDGGGRGKRENDAGDGILIGARFCCCCTFHSPASPRCSRLSLSRVASSA